MGLLGSLFSPSPVRNGLQPTAVTVRAATASAMRKDRFMIGSRLAVEGEGEDERARLRVVEVINTRHRGDRATEARFGIVSRVLGPRLEIPARQADVDAAHTEGAHHPRRIERVCHRDFAELHESGVLDARLIHARKRTGRIPGAIPALANRNGCARARSDDRAVPPATLAKGPTRTARLGILMRAVAPQRAFRPVPHLPTMADIEQAGDLHLAIVEAAADAAGPAWIGIRQQARIVVHDREARAVDIQRAA